MGEATRAEIKSSEAKKEKVSSQKQKEDISQLISSPIEQILFLQKAVGNQAVGRLIKSGALQANKTKVPDVSSELESSINAAGGGGQPLPESVRAFFEPRFNHDFGKVRVHTGSDAIQMNRDVGAKAFTHGSDTAP